MAGRGGGGFLVGASGSIPPFQQGGAFPQMGRHRMNPPHSNVMKKNTNWNTCYSCGFDLEDSHTLGTCPVQWRKITHIDAFTRENAQGYFSQGYDVCTKVMQYTVFPGGRTF